MRNACGSTTWRICSNHVIASDADASHWPFGIDSTQPRQISARKALVKQVSADRRGEPGRNVDAEIRESRRR